jgi:hypothetical protein
VLNRAAGFPPPFETRSVGPVVTPDASPLVLSAVFDWPRMKFPPVAATPTPLRPTKRAASAK